ncbi:MAG: DUF4013 domain-containing protein [Candidatus Woesearchaeota archaeon]
MNHFLFAIKRPFTNLLRLVAGSVLFILPIVNLFAFGYFVECARTAYKGNLDMPKWQWKLFIEGLIFLGIALIFYVPAGVLYFVMFYYGQDFWVFKGPIAALFALTIYILPGAIVRYAVEDFAAAFKGLFITTFNKFYFKAFALSLVWALVILLLMQVFYYILSYSVIYVYTFYLFGALISGVLLFASQVTIFTLIAEAYRRMKY